MTDQTKNQRTEAIAVVLDIWDLMERVGYLDLQESRLYDLRELIRDRALNIEPMVFDDMGIPSVSTLKVWRRKYRNVGQGRRGSGHFSSRTCWRDLVNRLLVERRGLKAVEIHQRILSDVAWKKAGWETPEQPPSQRTITRYVRDFRRLETTLPPGLLQRRILGDNIPLGLDTELGNFFPVSGA